LVSVSLLQDQINLLHTRSAPAATLELQSALVRCNRERAPLLRVERGSDNVGLISSEVGKEIRVIALLISAAKSS
jgi:hypothetical protein